MSQKYEPREIKMFVCTKHEHVGSLKRLGFCSRKFGDNVMVHFRCVKCFGLVHFQSPVLPGQIIEIKSPEKEKTMSEILKCCTMQNGCLCCL